MAAIKIPELYPTPKQISIRCEKITELKGTKEFIISIKINGESYTVFIPEGLTKLVIDRENNTIKAQEVGKFEEDLLVDLPVETLTSGPRIRIPKDFIGDVIAVEAT